MPPLSVYIVYNDYVSAKSGLFNFGTGMKGIGNVCNSTGNGSVTISPSENQYIPVIQNKLRLITI